MAFPLFKFFAKKSECVCVSDFRILLIRCWLPVLECVTQAVGYSYQLANYNKIHLLSEYGEIASIQKHPTENDLINLNLFFFQLDCRSRYSLIFHSKTQCCGILDNQLEIWQKHFYQFGNHLYRKAGVERSKFWYNQDISKLM